MKQKVRPSTVVLAALLTVFAWLLGSMSSEAANVYKENGFYYTLEYGEAYVEGYYGGSVMTIPSKLGGCTVVGINSVYYGSDNTYDSVVQLYIPDTVTKDLDCSLTGDSLKTVRLSSNIKKFGIGVFRRCQTLESVTNTSGVQSIETFAFQGCTSLKEISFPNVTEVGLSLCEGCTSLARASFPKVEKTGAYMFQGCISLSSVTLSPSLTELGNSTFYGCVNITSFAIPSTLKTIQCMAFKGSGLTSIYIPSTVTHVNWGAFTDCKSLKTVKFMPNEDILYRSMFMGCSELTQVEFREGLKEFRWDVFADCIKLTSITIPSTVTSIDTRAFSGCEQLREIKGYQGTAAETFAKSKGIPFTAMKAKISLNKTSATLYPTSGFNKIKLTVAKSGTTASVTFSSNKPSVAKVSASGVITARKSGTATITAKCGSLKATCKVVVKKSSIKVSRKALRIKKGKKVTLKVSATPEGKVKFASTNRKIAVVTSKGVVKAKKKGTCYIKVTMSGAAAKRVKVTVR